ncbi:hypothetical protein [Roseibacillus persicicus]|uniref:hypothetical protein n=1 Tax=Roseibacillus persicicus TaxID=454148 RepID=UPI00280F2FF1|nr:hypothetical protein [Roseibacillus persicicus]MDQ8191005.1 hypothetical protein [Roseibacillus persicicus]
MKEAKENVEKAKSPWIWKAAVVALPTGLLLSIVIAVALRINRGPDNGMLNLSYTAAELNVANLRDAVGKAEDLIGVRDFDTPAGQKAMQMMTAFIEGSIGPNNMGYQVYTDEGEVSGGRIWKNYWIDSSKERGDGTVLVACEYGAEDSSATVAALISLAEWLRGRTFERRVRVAFCRDLELTDLQADFSDKGRNTVIRVGPLGQGTEGLLKTGGATKDASVPAYYEIVGKPGVSSAADWKMTTAWEEYESQVRALCEEVRDEAVEKVVVER